MQFETAGIPYARGFFVLSGLPFGIVGRLPAALPRASYDFSRIRQLMLGNLYLPFQIWQNTRAHNHRRDAARFEDPSDREGLHLRIVIRRTKNGRHSFVRQNFFGCHISKIPRHG